MAPEPQQMSSSVMFLWSPAISVTVLTSTSAPVVLMQKEARGEMMKSRPDTFSMMLSDPKRLSSFPIPVRVFSENCREVTYKPI